MKIDLDIEKQNAIAKLMAVGGAGVEALKELFQAAEAGLRDVGNIDPKGNMGLQALAAQRALESLQAVKEHVFPETAARTGVRTEKAPVGQYR